MKKEDERENLAEIDKLKLKQQFREENVDDIAPISGFVMVAWLDIMRNGFQLILHLVT